MLDVPDVATPPPEEPMTTTLAMLTCGEGLERPCVSV